MLSVGRASPPRVPKRNRSYKNEVSMLTKIMMWVSIAAVLLALLELPVTSEPVLVEIVVFNGIPAATNMQTNFTPARSITIDEMTSRLRILPIQRKSNPSH